MSNKSNNLHLSGEDLSQLATGIGETANIIQAACLVMLILPLHVKNERLFETKIKHIIASLREATNAQIAATQSNTKIDLADLEAVLQIAEHYEQQQVLLLAEREELIRLVSRTEPVWLADLKAHVQSQLALTDREHADVVNQLESLIHFAAAMTAHHTDQLTQEHIQAVTGGTDPTHARALHAAVAAKVAVDTPSNNTQQKSLMTALIMTLAVVKMKKVQDQANTPTAKQPIAAQNALDHAVFGILNDAKLISCLRDCVNQAMGQRTAAGNHQTHLFNTKLTLQPSAGVSTNRVLHEECHNHRPARP